MSNMSFCKNCGNEISQDSKFCASCGTPVQIDIPTTEKSIQETSQEKYTPKSIDNELLSPIKGEVRSFTLCGHEIVISADRDLFNAYKMEFRRLARVCADNAVNEYISNIHNFDEFMSCFMDIYNSNLEVLTHKAIDVLIMEGIYTVTHDYFFGEHTEVFHLAIDDYNTMVESVNLTLEANNQVVGGLFDSAKNLTGNMMGKSGLGGGLLGSLMGGVSNGLLDAGKTEASKINDVQKAELYDRITPHLLFNRIYADYCNVFLTLTFELQNNGYNIYFPTEEMETQANAIFQNLLNPKFNQDKLIDVLSEIITIFPYNIEFFEFMKEKFGDTDEVEALISYYGYDFDENIYTEEQYPKLKTTKEVTDLSTPTVETTPTTNSDSGLLGRLNIDKEAVGNAFSSAKNSFGKSVRSIFGKK